MRLLLNQNLSAVSLSEINPNTTVLQWLRGNGLTGSKEGCASGDCGACTAVVGELIEVDGTHTLEYKSINTCIALACSLAGKHLVTVEGLSENNQLHPVQQAMVSEHGSQCGFCTPGFVMSLFALYHNETTIDLAKINNNLSGNLCRCTGYQPIINAAFLAFSNKDGNDSDYYSRTQTQIIQALVELSCTDTARCSYQGTHYDSPTDIDQLSDILNDNPKARIIAGGSDLSLEITQNLQEFAHIVNVQGVRELQMIENRELELEIGAAVSFHSAESNLIKYWPSLESFLHRFGSKPIRNWATIGGNIANASPIGDMPPVLIALNASLRLRKGPKTRLVKLEDYFVGYKQTLLKEGEFIESIIIPKPSSEEQLILHKISKRFEDDISAVCMAIKVRMDASRITDVCIAFGGMAATPKRASHLEKILLDNWDSANLSSLAFKALKEDFSPLSDVRASSKYRLQVSANLVQKTMLNLSGEFVPNLANVCEYESQIRVN
ncbi:MAG: xanthine dehydrogenase small subunit [Gammaproteobacteria bacterium]|nr:xanthine dehydrogenase small subunit [Gammaproteobacteria bacterium]